MGLVHQEQVVKILFDLNTFIIATLDCAIFKISIREVACIDHWRRIGIFARWDLSSNYFQPFRVIRFKLLVTNHHCPIFLVLLLVLTWYRTQLTETTSSASEAILLISICSSNRSDNKCWTICVVLSNRFLLLLCNSNFMNAYRVCNSISSSCCFSAWLVTPQIHIRRRVSAKAGMMEELAIILAHRFSEAAVPIRIITSNTMSSSE